jgi:peptide/nickel transport system permease protein
MVMTIGVSVGLCAGYCGRQIDWVLMRLTDVVMSIPALFVALIIVAALRPSVATTVVVIGLVYWPPVARVVRGQVLSLREIEFTTAALALGARDLRVAVRHVLPNLIGILIVQLTLFVARAILVESGLSFLGVGVQPPAPSWGNMLADGRVYLQQAWWVATFPGIAIFLAVFGFNVLGDALREILDPRLR